MAASLTRRRLCAGIVAACAVTIPAAAADLPLAFTLNARIEGPAAPFLLPFDRGYYKAEKLNVGIETSAGSVEAIERVASGNAEMGVADISALIRYRDSHPDTPVKAVFVIYNRPPFAVTGRRSRGVEKPKDLEGKRIGVPVAGATFAQWPIFVKQAGLDNSKITIENVGIPVREPMLAAGQIDAVTGMSLQVAIGLRERGVPASDIVVMLMSDFGVELYGDAVIVNTRFAERQPEAVKGFLRALVKGLKETAASPATAVASVLARNEAAGKVTETERLMMALRDNIVTPEVKANGFGGIDAARFARTIDQIAMAYSFTSAKPKLEDIFDAAFLPASSERRAF